MVKPFVFLGIFGILSTTGAVADDTGTVFTNGTIYTSNGQAPWASAVVVKGDKIAFVGTDSGALTFAGPGARTIDLGGNLVIPGIVDSHTHPGLVAVSHDLLEMEIVQDKETLMQNITDMIAANPDRDGTSPDRNCHPDHFRCRGTPTRYSCGP